MNVAVKQLPARDAFKHFLTIPTRWMDNDIYGHVNNVVYYSYFDTLVNEYYIRCAGFDIHRAEVIGIVAETFCQFHASLAFPELIEGGLRVERLGNTSVKYQIGLFQQASAAPAATGHFVHVFVERAGMRPTPIPPQMRTCLERLI